MSAASILFQRVDLPTFVCFPSTTGLSSPFSQEAEGSFFSRLPFFLFSGRRKGGRHLSFWKRGSPPFLLIEVFFPAAEISFPKLEPSRLVRQTQRLPPGKVEVTPPFQGPEVALPVPKYLPSIGDELPHEEDPSFSPALSFQKDLFSFSSRFPAQSASGGLVFPKIACPSRFCLQDALFPLLREGVRKFFRPLSPQLSILLRLLAKATRSAPGMTFPPFPNGKEAAPLFFRMLFDKTEREVPEAQDRLLPFPLSPALSARSLLAPAVLIGRRPCWPSLVFRRPSAFLFFLEVVVFRIRFCPAQTRFFPVIDVLLLRDLRVFFFFFYGRIKGRFPSHLLPGTQLERPFSFAGNFLSLSFPVLLGFPSPPFSELEKGRCPISPSFLKGGGAGSVPPWVFFQVYPVSPSPFAMCSPPSSPPPFRARLRIFFPLLSETVSSPWRPPASSHPELASCSTCEGGGGGSFPGNGGSLSLLFPLSSACREDGRLFFFEALPPLFTFDPAGPPDESCPPFGSRPAFFAMDGKGIPLPRPLNGRA